MIDYLQFWLARSLADLLVLVGLTLLAAGVPLALLTRTAFKQWRCSHEKFWENSACDAICLKCGKNLGFIQKIRDARARRAN